jgi:two-component system OmpR family response regulator
MDDVSRPTFAQHKNSIAIVEDDPFIRNTVADIVETAGFEAVCYDRADAILSDMRSGSIPDLIVLDLHLPDNDGLMVAGSIRAMSDVPIIILTGRSDEIDRILGLEIGADDYVVKPFNNRELLARIKAILRRLSRDTAPRNMSNPRAGYRFGGFVLDTDARKLEAPGGALVPLTVAEFNLLLVLLNAHGRVLSRDQLLELTHRGDHSVFDRTIDVLILRLRRKLENTPEQPRFIRTERGLGYIFDAEVETFPAAAGAPSASSSISASFSRR